MRGQNRQMRRRRGFTLIELIMVMVITSVLALTAQQAIQGLDSTRLHGAARKLRADIRYAQTLAMARRVSASAEPAGYGVQFDPNPQNRYRVFKVSDGVNASDPFTGDPGLNGADWTSGFRVVYTSDQELQGVSLVSTSFSVAGFSNELRFDSVGRPWRRDAGNGNSFILLSADGQVTIRQQGSGETMIVTITPDTGRVS